MPKVIDRPWPPRSTIVTGDDVAAVGACLSGIASYLRRGPRFEVTATDAALAHDAGDADYIKRAGGVTGCGDGEGFGFGYGDGNGHGFGEGYGDGDGASYARG